MATLDQIEKGTLRESPTARECHAERVSEAVRPAAFRGDPRVPENVRLQLELTALRLSDISRELEAVDFLDANRAAATITRCCERVKNERSRLLACVADTLGIDGKRAKLEKAREHLLWAIRDVEGALEGRAS